MANQSLQQECRRRAAKKLAATLLFPDFRFPTALSAEQCTGDDLAELHAAMVPVGSRVVDLTCGLGIDAFHIARRAENVIALDLDPTVAAAIGPNAQALGLKNVKGVNADCTEWLKECPEKFDVAFIDPARRGNNGRRLFSLHDCKPDVVELLPAIQRIARLVIVKMSPMLDIEAILRELPETARLHVLGTTAECKELVAEIESGFTGETEIIVQTVGKPALRFRRSEIAKIERYANEIKPGDTIGEPWPTVMKAAPWGLLSGLELHPDSHVWLNPGPDFPGKTYRAERIEEFSSSNIKRLAKERLSASVAVKNLPITAADLSRRLKSTESSTRRLLATTLYPTRRLILLLNPVSATSIG